MLDILAGLVRLNGALTTCIVVVVVVRDEFNNWMSHDFSFHLCVQSIQESKKNLLLHKPFKEPQFSLISTNNQNPQNQFASSCFL